MRAVIADYAHHLAPSDLTADTAVTQILEQIVLLQKMRYRMVVYDIRVADSKPNMLGYGCGFCRRKCSSVEKWDVKTELNQQRLSLGYVDKAIS